MKKFISFLKHYSRNLLLKEFIGAVVMWPYFKLGIRLLQYFFVIKIKLSSNASFVFSLDVQMKINSNLFFNKVHIFNKIKIQ